VRVGHVAEAITAVDGTDATRQRVRATLRSALNDTVREGLIVVNPAALVRLPTGRRPKALVWTDERVQRWTAAVEHLASIADDDPGREQLEAAAQPPSAVMVWTPPQLGRFLDAVRRDRLYVLYHLVGYRGLRRGVVCGLEWSDLDLDLDLDCPRTPVGLPSPVSSCSWAGTSSRGRRSPTPAAGRSRWMRAPWRRCERIAVPSSPIGPRGVRRGSSPARCSPARTAPRYTRLR
jgi:integrase